MLLLFSSTIIKKATIFIAFQFLALSIYAQDDFAVIKDKDEYTNVREGDSKSKIIGRILKYQPFDCIESQDGNPKPIENMASISYENYVEKRGCNYLQNDENASKDGYIHISRIQKLVDLPALKKSLVTRNKAVFKNDTLSVTIELAPFDYKKHILKNDKGKIITQSSTNIASIDNEKVWGTDGNIPHTGIKSITVTYKDKTLSLSANSLKNIFEPDADNTRICIGLDGELYIWQQNSDGAGSYNVIWVIVDGELKYRYVGLSWYA